MTDDKSKPCTYCPDHKLIIDKAGEVTPLWNEINKRVQIKTFALFGSGVGAVALLILAMVFNLTQDVSQMTAKLQTAIKIDQAKVLAMERQVSHIATIQRAIVNQHGIVARDKTDFPGYGG